MNMGQFTSSVISAKGVRDAADRLAGRAVRTPLIENTVLNDIAGGRVFLKAEVLQLGGAFKFRGAYNMISQIPPDERARGVMAWSSGNHAQGVARAAAMFGMKSLIVMPTDAPKIKADAVASLGAEIVTYDRYTDDREEIARDIMKTRGMHLAPSFDHPEIIHGQGTVALESIEQLDERNAGSPDVFVVCCGGGGLTTGCAIILNDCAPDCDVWIAEPEGYAETWASIENGERQTADVSLPTICDAIATPTPGQLTLPIMQQFVRGGTSISEADVRAAVRFSFEQLKLVVEPGGAVALASILNRSIALDGRTAVVTLSGGNIDSALHAAIVTS